VLLCVIVKNEAHNLRDCVAPVGEFVDSGKRGQRVSALLPR
jgi:hypothetical protein